MTFYRMKYKTVFNYGNGDEIESHCRVIRANSIHEAAETLCAITVFKKIISIDYPEMDNITEEEVKLYYSFDNSANG